MFWEKLPYRTISAKVFEALSGNVNYRTERILGVPGTFLDEEVFSEDAPFLQDAPFLSAMIANPNHIGVHTLDNSSEDFFSGTHALERDLIRICAEEIFGAGKGGYDGYVASGGTEANIEALWIYRNYFRDEENAASNEIAVVYSSDTHYSIPKGIDLLGLSGIEVPVDEHTREIKLSRMESLVNAARKKGYKYFIVILNMGTTMFGSVDDADKVCGLLDLVKVNYRAHVDGAFGGFIYPFTSGDHNYSFTNPRISSFSIDGHKMLQAPYGTGIFLVRKNLLKYVCTREAGYVKGKDHTLCGSRSGANAVCVWMILRSYGSVGWKAKVQGLIGRTDRLCATLRELGVEHFRNKNMNMAAIRARDIGAELARKYHLVPDDHHTPAWYKIVLMQHAKEEVVEAFLGELRSALAPS